MKNESYNSIRVEGLKKLKKTGLSKELYEKEVVNRRVGWSYAHALSLVGEALGNPNVEIKLSMDTKGPSNSTIIKLVMLPLVKGIITKLGLTDFVIDKDNLTIKRILDFPKYDDL